MQNEWSWVWGTCGIGGAGKSDKVITGGASKALPERCKQKIRRLKNSGFQLVEKVCFFKKSACSQSLSPNPFPVGRGYITGATAPSPCRGLRPCDPIFK